MVKSKWLAALSDGTTFIEDEVPFNAERGDLSPWQQLMAHLKQNDLYITGMRVQVGKQTHNLPSFNVTPGGRHEKWPALYPRSPVEYSYGRWVTTGTGSTPDRHQIEIRARYADFTVSLFVDEDEGNEAWVVVHE